MIVTKAPPQRNSQYVRGPVQERLAKAVPNTIPILNHFAVFYLIFAKSGASAYVATACGENHPLSPAVDPLPLP
jgi:hypothetical protein